MELLKPFFKKPYEKYLIRELARITGINHTTVRQKLEKFTKQKLLKKVKGKPYDYYQANVESNAFLLKKLAFNLEQIQPLVEFLEDHYDFPDIVLFGSYAKAMDDEKSDIDIFIPTNITSEPDLSSYEKALERHISLFIWTKAEFQEAKRKSKHLVNNICNGITLSGQLKVL